MNKIYSKVCNRGAGQGVAMSGLASGDSVGAIAARGRARRGLLALSVMLLGAPGGAWAADAVCYDPVTGKPVGSASGTGNEVACGDGAVASGVAAIAIGTNAIASGASSIAIGVGAQAPGNRVIAIGNLAGAGSTTGFDNLAIGVQSGQNNSSSANTAVGLQVGNYVSSASNVAVGSLGTGSNVSDTSTQPAVFAGVTGNNVAVGGVAGSSVKGALNVGVGWKAGRVVDGYNNIGVGALAGYKTTGDNNIGIGSWAGSTVTGHRNIGVGNNAGNTVAGLANAAIGDNAGDAVKGDSNFAGGKSAGSSVTGSSNIALGNSAGSGITADNTIAIGSQALAAASSAVAIGNGARATGSQSISVGTGNLVSGDHSGAIGDPTTITGSGSYSLGNNNTLSANNVFVVGSNVTISSGLDGAVVLGANSTVAASAPMPSGTVNGASYIYAGGSPAPGGVVSVGTAGAERQIQNVAAGQISAGSTDAINGSQLYATNRAVAASQTHYYDVNDGGIQQGNYNNDGATGINSVAAGVNALAAGGNSVAIGYGAQANESDSTAVGPSAAAGVNGTSIGMMAGAGSTGANNVAIGYSAGQGNSGNRNVAIGEYAGNAMGGENNLALGNTAGMGISGYNNIAIGMSAGAGVAADDTISLGRGAKADNTGDVALGSGSTTDVAVATAGITLNGIAYGFAGTGPTSTISVGADGSERTVTNVAAGRIGAASTDAINGSQLYATNQAVERVANVAGSGWNISAQGANGTTVAPGAAVDLSNTDGNIKLAKTTSNNDVTFDLSPDLNINSVTTGNTVMNSRGVTVGGGPNGTVSLTNAGLNNGGNVITHVAAGLLSSTSTDAVNGSQLYATNQQVQVNATRIDNVSNAITRINHGATGPFQVSQDHNAPSPAPTGYNSAAGGAGAVASGNNSLAVGNDSTAGGANATAVGTGAKASAEGSTALGEGAMASTPNSVALGAGAITAAAVGVTSAMVGGVTYGGFAGSTPTGVVSVGAAGQERQISRVAAGQVTVTSTDAVNGSQLYSVANQVSQLGTSVLNVTHQVNQNATDIRNLQNGSDGMFQVSADANTTKPVASGTQSTAGGNGAAASGNRSTAVGHGAQATADNSVAIGAGSVADRADSVSVGAQGRERQVTNVAAGKASTDAVNVGQLQAAQAGSVHYDTNADGSIDYSSVTLNPGGSSTAVHNVGAGKAATDAVNVGQLDRSMQQVQNWSKSYTDRAVNNLGAKAFAGVASAIAMASMPQAYQPNQSSAGVALGNFHGESGVAVGMSTISESGRMIFKVNASTNTRGDAGVGVGAGVVW